MLLQLWEQWLGPAACCSSSTNSPSPSPHAAGDEFLQPARARTQRTAASQRQHCTSALHRGTDTPNSHPQPCGGEPFTATSFVSLRHVTLARRCRQLGSVRAEPRQVSHGQCSQPGTATVEQNWSRAVHRQLSHIPNRFGWLSWSPAAIAGRCSRDIQSFVISVSTRPRSTDTPHHWEVPLCSRENTSGELRQGEKTPPKLHPHYTV